MGDCQTPEKINDNLFACLAIPNVADVKVIMDENVGIQEYEHRPDGNDIVLTDNFIVDLLSRDSVADAEGKVLISNENEEQSGNALISNLVTSDDKHAIVTDEDNSRTTLETGIQKSVRETVPSECVNSKVLNELQKNMTVEKELGNSIFSNSTCVSSNLELEIGGHKTVDENMESADIVERSCIEKDVIKLDCEMPKQENSLASNVTSDDKHAIVTDEDNSRTTLETGIQKSVRETVSSECVNSKVLNELQKNMTIEKNSIFSNYTCVSSNLELEIGGHETVDENMESADIVERSCIEKDVIKLDCEMPKQESSLASNVTSDDKHALVTDEDNSRTTLETGIQKSVRETVSSECVNSKVLNELQKNMTIEKNSIFSNYTCVSSNLELEIGGHKTVDENMESADFVERSCIEKDVIKLDCEMPKQENSLASNVTDSLKKSDETVKEVSIQEAPQSNFGKEQSLEGMSHTFNQSKYRCESDIWTDDDDGSSTSDSSSSDSSSSEFFQEMCEKSKPKKMHYVKTKGELSLDELPPIEDLDISVNEKEMTAVGKIYAVVEKLVVIHSMKGMKALDLDSVLFLSHDQPLGRVFDVFGPVNEPFYSVRFNSVEQINEKGVKVGLDVFFAPEKSDITTYVFIERLQNQRGSDASWKHNNEPPEECLDYSDDEQEQYAKRQRKFKNRNRQFSDNSDVPAKRSLLAEDSAHFIHPPKPAPQWNRPQNIPYRFARPNPFQSPVPSPSPSPSPSVHGFMSPVRVQNSFSLSPNQPQRLVQPQNIIYRPPPQLFVSRYQEPHHVFGQLTVLNHLSPAFHTPPPLPSPAFHRPPPLPSPVMNNVPTLVPASHFSAPQNYFNQTFTRSPSPVTHNPHMSPNPWLSNRPHNSMNVPPSHPLTVQIPNMGSPSLPMHQFSGDRGSVQQFVNIQNGNYEPFVNNRNLPNFPPVNVQPRFYHS